MKSRPNQAMQLTAPGSVPPLRVAETSNLQRRAVSGAVADLVFREAVMQRTLESLDQWKIPFAILVAYWIIATLVMWLVYRRWCSKRRAANPSRFRFWLALVISMIFTPSLVGDFWLFAVPAPAVLGLLWFIPVGFYEPVYWLIALVFYILPMTVVFIIAYAVLRRQDHHLYPRTA